MDRLQAFEAMLHDIQEQCEREKKAMDELKAHDCTRNCLLMHLSDHLYCCIKNQYTYGKLHKPGVKRMTLGLFHFCPKSAIIQSA